MTIEIVIPSYNQELYLSDAIESSLLQNCEVVVVDDGSTDNSLEIARKYPIKVISQVNKGLASARNTGIMNATGEAILFLDADDILLKGCVDLLRVKMEETNADVVAGSFKTFGTTNEEVILMPHPFLGDFKVGNRLGYCALIKKEVLLEVGGYSPKMLWGYEDMHLWINLLTRGKKIVTIPEVLWLYRTKEHSMIHDAQKHHGELMKQIHDDFPQF